MSNKVEYYDFRKDLYFYDLVSSFSISLCGCPVIFDKNVPMYLPENQTISFPGQHTAHKQMMPSTIRKMAENGHISKSKHIASCCMMLANTAYESCKQHNDGSEIFEFFRHIRNASSHLNVFLFNHKEPANPATWRGAKFDHHNKGDSNSLYKQTCFGYFMGVADILDLLMDIEKIIIEQNKNSAN